MNSLAEIEELRSLRSNVRRSLEALEVCWSCGAVGESVPWNADGQTVRLCVPCNDDRQQRAAESISRTLHRGSN